MTATAMCCPHQCPHAENRCLLGSSKQELARQSASLATQQISYVRLFTFYFLNVIPYKSNRNITVLTRSLQ